MVALLHACSCSQVLEEYAIVAARHVTLIALTFRRLQNAPLPVLYCTLALLLALLWKYAVP